MVTHRLLDFTIDRKWTLLLQETKTLAIWQLSHVRMDESSKGNLTLIIYILVTVTTV